MATKKSPQGDIQGALSALRKGGLKIGAFADFDNVKPVGLSTGNFTLDAQTGIGGIPKGRITELIGPPSSGKTTTALMTSAEYQQAGGIVAYFDYERSMDPAYCQSLGLDVYAESFLYARPKHFEEGAQAFRELLAAGVPLLGVFDSVATMVTQHELEAATGAVQVADRAKMLHQFLRQLNPVLADTGSTAVFINHVMELVDASPMGRQLAARGIKRKTSPGGKALPFYASLRLEFNQIGTIKNEEFDPLSNETVKRVTQQKVEVTSIKNKAGGKPFLKSELRVRWLKGFSQNFSVYTMLLDHGVLTKSGAWIKFPAELAFDSDGKIQGEEAVLKTMDENPDWAAKLEHVARKILEQLGEDAFETVTGTDLTASEAAEADEVSKSAGGLE